MIPKVAEYGMVIVSDTNEDESILYGYVVL